MCSKKTGMVDSRKIKRMVERSRYLKWRFPQRTSTISSSKKHCTRQETIFPITEGRRDIRRGTSTIKKRKGRITSQFQSCFKNFSGCQFTYTHEDGNYGQNRVLGHMDLVRNNRHEKQCRKHDSDQNDLNHAVHDQTNCQQNSTRDNSKTNTVTEDKPILPFRSSVKEVIVNDRVSVSDCNERNPEINESTTLASERSLFGEFQKCLDSFKSTFATSVCQAKTRWPHTFTVTVNTSSNKTSKQPGTLIDDSSARVHVAKSMESDTNGTNAETLKKTVKRIIGKETDCVSDEEVINGAMKQYNPTLTDNFKNWFKHYNTLKENNVPEEMPVRKVSSKHEHLQRACSLPTSKPDRIHTKDTIETVSKKENKDKETAAEYLPPKKRFCFSFNHSPMKKSEMSKDALKSILKSPRSAFKHEVSPRKQMVCFVEDVSVAIKDKERGLVTTPKRLLSNSSDVMKATSQSSTKKRSRPKLTEAQIKLAEIVKRLKMERINGRKDTKDNVIPKSNTVPCASSLSKHFQGKNLTILIEAPHKKKKSASRVVKSTKKDMPTTTSVVSNSSSSQLSPVISTKELVIDACICQPCKETPQKEMLSSMKEKEIDTHITSFLRNIRSSNGNHFPCAKDVVTNTSINKLCRETPSAKMVYTKGKEIDRCNTLIQSANSSSGESHDTTGVKTDTSIYKLCRETPSSSSEQVRGCAKEVVADTSLLKGEEIPSSKVNNSEKYTGNITHDYKVHQKSSFARTKLTSIRLFPCHLCDKKFISPAKLESHKPTHHTLCPSINFALTSIDDPPDKVQRRMALNDGENTHKENHLENHNVKECGIKNVTDSSRDDGNEIESKDVNRLKSACNSEIDLINHPREKKTNGTTQCTHCNREFKNMENLKRHERAHTMGKEHACVFCKETFSLSSERNKHERVHGIKETCSCEE
ncbi:uncharacterized protein LOC117111107 [Anneissia japonica]|uniref:uncharacterized protein LOC117111107 n=1 Tax=Anneissia japonica TaxID=1529436 RepID=UPI0014254FD6|nr:uncharacterized protein LOC117111107 [Anneissia japonica]